jgi:hypothetical protein
MRGLAACGMATGASPQNAAFPDFHSKPSQKDLSILNKMIAIIC